MNQEFGKKSKEEQQALVTEIGKLLIENKIPAEIKTIQEVVCNVQGDDVEHNVSLSVSGEFPLSMKASIDKFNQDVKKHTEGVDGVSIGLACVVGAGMPYQTIENVTSINDDKKVSLEHNGQAMLIDFWATWCPPCQAPMAHNQSMLEKKGDAWKGNLRIIGLSIDQGREAVVKHVEDKKWNLVEHFHRSTSSCSQVYGVRGVPCVMLVDKQGTIVFKGHPASRPNLEDDLDKLANGEELSGEGIEKLKAESSGEVPEIKPAEGFSDLDIDTLAKEIADFKETCSGFQKDETIKNHAKGMPRSFCVIVLQSAYNPNTQKTLSKYENYRVLVGKQESVDALKAAFEEKVKGSFEVNNQIRAI